MNLPSTSCRGLIVLNHYTVRLLGVMAAAWIRELDYMPYVQQQTRLMHLQGRNLGSRAL
jgi:hypothetical protein